ncbi:MAG TPA: LamG-like jellyroll fold domain-containing protein [Bacteroidia bacterium]|nr:LamG-like jellyroll fold domain-containing protein [Bacteroidia bacterium]
MKTAKNKYNDGSLEAVTIITFFIILFLVTVFAGSAAAQPVNGNSGHCLEFNGTTSGVTFNNNNLGLTGNTMSVTAWVKCNSTTNEGNWGGIVSVDNASSSASGDDGQFWLQHSQLNTQFEFAVETTNGRQYVQSVTSPVTGQWYHVAGVYDGSYVNIYVNGVLESRYSQTGNINNFNGQYNLVLGQWANPGNAYRRFNGDIDEVTIWNVALTQTQIRAYMCKKLQGTESGLVAYFRMNETSGTRVNDVTSNGRKGTSSNTTIVWSGAPIGDASVNTYGGTRLSINNPTYDDSLSITNFSSTPTGIQLYRIDTMPNTTTAPAGYTSLATGYYYGVFVIGSSSATYKVNYYYTGNPMVTAKNLGGLANRSDNSVMTWTDLATSAISSTSVLQKAGQSGRNEFIPELTISPMPISLLNFSATPDGTVVDIKWSTASEVNNHFFTIERTTDGTHYETVAIINGAGNSDNSLSYSAKDENPVEGLSYYRLKQTDFDGESKTFENVAVNYTEGISTSLTAQHTYPNPFKTSFFINFESDKATQLSVEILSSTGSMIDAETINCTKGNTQYEYQKGYMLTSGIYFIHITDLANGQGTVQKIIKL